jgi:hypothetical protein
VLRGLAEVPIRSFAGPEMGNRSQGCVVYLGQDVTLEGLVRSSDRQDFSGFYAGA